MFYYKIKTVASFFVLLFLVACSLPDKSKMSKSEISESPIIVKDDSTFQLSEPRVDSILEFESMITAIFEDSKGNIWFGSHCDGVCRYDGKQFTYFTIESGLPKKRNSELPYRNFWLGNSIRYIYEDDKGNMWFGTGEGVSKFDGNTFTTIHPEKESILITEQYEVVGKKLNVDWEKEYDALWFGAERNGVVRYDGYQLKHLRFPEPESEKDKPWSRFDTYSLYKDSHRNIWFGTESGGIFRYNQAAFTCINEQEEKGIVRSFFQDASGKIWISNVLLGLYCYDHTAYLSGEKALKSFTKEKGWYSLSEVRNNPLLDKSKMLDGIQTIAQDDDGNLWFGSYANGLWKYDGKEITHYHKENGLPSDTVKTIYKDKSGRMWFGIGEEKGYLYQFNGTSFEKFRGR